MIICYQQARVAIIYGDFLFYCCFSYAGNWELVKSIVGTKFRRSHACLHYILKWEIGYDI